MPTDSLSPEEVKKDLLSFGHQHAIKIQGLPRVGNHYFRYLVGNNIKDCYIMDEFLASKRTGPRWAETQLGHMHLHPRRWYQSKYFNQTKLKHEPDEEIYLEEKKVYLRELQKKLDNNKVFYLFIVRNPYIWYLSVSGYDFVKVMDTLKPYDIEPDIGGSSDTEIKARMPDFIQELQASSISGDPLFPIDPHWISLWNDTNGIYHRFCQENPDTSLMVRHEELMATPEHIISLICEKFGLELRNQELDTPDNDVLPGLFLSTKKAKIRTLEESMEFYSKQDIELFNKLLHSGLMGEIGYNMEEK